jgi:uncharacterized protein YbjT (DUF2867 family)
MSDVQSKVALLAGATGLVGGVLLDVLLEAGDFSRVVAVTRRPLAREHPRLANRTVQFDKIASQFAASPAIAPSAAWERPSARQGPRKHSGASTWTMCSLLRTWRRRRRRSASSSVSSVGANARSGNFYLRTKGEMEDALVAANLPALDILQPGVLLGWRRELRPLELAATLLMPLVNPLLVGPYAIYRGISGTHGRARHAGRRAFRPARHQPLRLYRHIALARKGAARAAL